MPGVLGRKRYWSDHTEGNERAALIEHLSEAAIPPTHRPAIDPVPVLLPRRLFICLKDALEALDKGEVHSVFQPTAEGRHGEPWTWDKMRARAVEHVVFLHGQGVQLRIARQRVGTAMKVSPETLRQWERDQSLGANVETARKAGAYKARLDANPKHYEDDGQSVDAHVLALFIAFRDEPLAAFGERYRQRFGTRHNT